MAFSPHPKPPKENVMLFKLITKRLLLAAGVALAGALVVGRFRAAGRQPTLPEDAAPARTREADVDGIRMRWEHHGTRPAAARALGPILGKLPTPVVRILFQTALKNLGHTNAAIAAGSLRLFWRPYAEVGPSALANQVRFFDNHDTDRIGRALRPMQCPATVVWGERDPLGLGSARRLARRIGAELRIVPGSYHFTIEDHPEVIADAVLDVAGRHN